MAEVEEDVKLDRALSAILPRAAIPCRKTILRWNDPDSPAGFAILNARGYT